MAIVALIEPQDNVFEWDRTKDRKVLHLIHGYGRLCREIHASGEEFQRILHYTKGIPNLSDMNDTEMYFVGDWAKMIARNILYIFPEGWDNHG